MGACSNDTVNTEFNNHTLFNTLFNTMFNTSGDAVLHVIAHL